MHWSKIAYQRAFLYKLVPTVGKSWESYYPDEAAHENELALAVPVVTVGDELLNNSL